MTARYTDAFRTSTCDRVRIRNSRLLVILTFVGMLLKLHPLAAQTPVNPTLRDQALQLYNAEQISSPDAKGRYDYPDGAKSRRARQARRLLEKNAAAGNTESYMLLGLMHEVGAGGPRSYTRARKIFARSDDRNSLWHLGLLLLDGKGGPKDLHRARASFKCASDKGSIDARYEYARMVELGLGGPKDVVEARRTYEATLPWGHGDARKHLSMMLMRGIGGERDHIRAAAEQIEAVRRHNHHFEVPYIITSPKSFDRDTIREMQKLMNSGGLYPGPLDGKVGPQTRETLMLELFGGPMTTSRRPKLRRIRGPVAS